MNSRSTRELSGNQVHVWAVNLEACELQALEKTLSSEELKRASTFRFAQDQRRFIVTRGILRSLLTQYLETSAREIRFRYSAHGRPALDSPVSKLEFNVAHSGSMALLAFSVGRRIGVDLEKIREDMAFEPIMERYFSSYETEAIKQLPSEERRRAFFVCWTRKEAYLKATGEGLVFDLNRFDVTVAPESAALLNVQGEPEAPRIWDLKNMHPAPGYVGTVAAEGRKLEFLSWEWTEWNESNGIDRKQDQS
jgi:4'-phosphopantetheinyl transferase